jgi:hypothetical protein
VTSAGVVGGAYVAIRYGRRANASITAEAHRTASGDVVVVARPQVTALGWRRLQLKSAEITVTEVLQGDTGEMVDGKASCEPVFCDQHAEPGETLTSTTAIPWGSPSTKLIGWRASIHVDVRRWSGGTWSWSDQIFVPHTP